MYVSGFWTFIVIIPLLLVPFTLIGAIILGILEGIVVVLIGRAYWEE